MLNEGKMDASDLAEKVDIFWAVADIYNVEKHLAHSIMQMPEELKPKYIEIYNEIRKIRAKVLARLLTNKKYDLWCPGKHLIGAVMQLTEVALKDKYQGNEKEALEMMKYAKDLYDIFWLIQEMGKVYKEKKQK